MYLNLDSTHERAQTNLKYYEQYLKLQCAQSGIQLGETGTLDEARRTRDVPEKAASDAESSKQEQNQNEEVVRQVPDTEVYEALCRGADTSDPAMARFKPLLVGRYQQQYCFLMRDGHPALLIAPARVEQMLADPRVLLFHDMIYPHEIEVIKQTAAPYVC